MTEYHYDDQGRLSYAVTTHEPLFSQDDTDAALERAAEKAIECPGCGQPVDEAWPQDPDALEAERVRWKAEPIKCAPCSARDSAKRQYEAAESVDRSGIHFPLTTRD